MVRTLDFHSKNVGSNPTSLSITTSTSINLIKLNQQKLNTKPMKVKHILKFSTIYVPSTISNVRLTINSLNFFKKKKVYVKQSYVLLA